MRNGTGKLADTRADNREGTMSEPAAIAAQIVDIRNLGTQKVVKITVHAPQEEALAVIDAFGWPTAVDPVPVAIARLDLNAAREGS